MKTRRIMMAVAMMLVCMISVAQDKRLMAFQTVMAMHDTTYKNMIKDGKYKEAIAPLTTLINILDTTTICQDTEISPEMIKVAKADYLYDQACCFAHQELWGSDKHDPFLETGKGQFSFQSQREAMSKNVKTSTQVHSSHKLAKLG